MNRPLRFAWTLICLTLASSASPALAREPSPEAKLFLYCTAVFSMVQGEAQKRGDTAGVEAMKEMIARTAPHGRSLLDAQGFSQTEVAAAITSTVDQVIDEYQEDKPRSFSQEQCFEAAKTQ